MTATATTLEAIPDIGKKDARKMTKAQLQREVEAMVEEKGLLNHAQEAKAAGGQFTRGDL